MSTQASFVDFMGDRKLEVDFEDNGHVVLTIRDDPNFKSIVLTKEEAQVLAHTLTGELYLKYNLL